MQPETLPPSHELTKDYIAHCRANCFEAAFLGIDAFIKNPAYARLDKKIKKEIKALHKEIKLMYKARKSWGLQDGQTPPPLNNGAPGLFTFNGIGTMMYGNTQYFTFFFVPVLPLSRYAVLANPKGGYNFFGDLKLTKFQQIWKWSLAIAAVCCILFVIIKKSL
ncbi:MAG: hypothetical protein LBR90_04740 [Elusimicrobiota bacterium]|jgi:hypothetical protein|nr:hypothetical protein [Elusimicrobiota bacterium]